jgi:hypothetical protein
MSRADEYPTTPMRRGNVLAFLPLVEEPRRQAESDNALGDSQ